MVRIDPCLRSRLAVGGDQEDDILGPERPSYKSHGQHITSPSPCEREKPTFEVSRQRQRKSNPIGIQFPIRRLPSRNQHNGLRSISAWRIDNRISILSLMRNSSRRVLVVLRRDFQPGGS